MNIAIKRRWILPQLRILHSYFNAVYLPHSFNSSWSSDSDNAQSVAEQVIPNRFASIKQAPRTYHIFDKRLERTSSCSANTMTNLNQNNSLLSAFMSVLMTSKENQILFIENGALMRFYNELNHILD